MNFKPIGTQVLVEFEENKPVGDIVLPEQMETFDFSMFVVRAVGEGFLLTTGEYKPLPVQVGDRVAMLPSAKGNMTGLPKHLIADRKLAVVEIRHIAGVWEGDLPSPRLMRKLVKELVH